MKGDIHDDKNIMTMTMMAFVPILV